MVESSIPTSILERDESLKRRNKVSAQMEARSAAETCSIGSEVDLVSTQAQVETEQQSREGGEAQEETLKSQINTQHDRRHHLRQVQKDMVSSINASAVVLVLLASVTFIGFMQPPGGLDDDGHLKVNGTSMKRFIIYIAVAFYLAVAGILVCMSCIAFALPRATKHAGRSLMVKMKSKYPSVRPGLNSGDREQNTLNFEVRTNDKMSRALKVAHIHEILANLCFVGSLLLSVNAFRMSADVVINGTELQNLTSQVYWDVIDNTFKVFFYSYFIRLLINIVIAGKALVADLKKNAKRLSFKSVVRLKTFRTLA